MFNFFRMGGAQASGRPLAEWVADVAEGRAALIDVRNLGEVQQTGKARGAIHVPLGSLPHWADPANPESHDIRAAEKPIAVYCASGARSGMAAEQLRALGFARAENIGGLNDWVRAGGAVER